MASGAHGKRLFAGLVLVVAGGVLLASRLMGVDQAPLWLLGAGVLLGLYGILTRGAGWIEVGMLGLGLGAGMLLGDVMAAGIPKGVWLPLALGAALLLAWVIVRLLGFQRRWWPLPLAAVLLALAAVRLAGPLAWRLPPAAEQAVRIWWPVALVVAGALLIVTALRRRG